MSQMIADQDIHVSELWELEPVREGKYTEDHVIDAYLKGKKTGLESHQRALVRALNDNVDLCGSYTTEVLDYLRDSGIATKDAFLNISKFDLFKVMICIPEKDFLNETIFDVYDFTTKFEDSKNNEKSTFSIQFSFLDFNDSFCTNTLHSDGYRLKFKK